MADYQVTVSTSHLDNAGTFNHVFIKLVGRDGTSKRTRLMDSKGESSFTRGSVSTFTVSCPVSIGKLVLIELEKQPSHNEDKWFPTKVEVKSPEGDTLKFLICRWITDSKVYRFREGREPDERPFRKPDIRSSVLEAEISRFSIYSRKIDLKVSRFRERTDLQFAQGTCLLDQRVLLEEQRAEARLLSLPIFGWFEDQEGDYGWHQHAKGIPHCMKAAGQCSLPNEVWFSLCKIAEFHYYAAAGLGTLKLRGLADSKENWTDIDEINGVFWHNVTEISDYVQEHWKEDALFGYQFLNGVNPMVIRRCSALPDNFPVTDNMVFPNGPFSLADEMEKGNIFLCDYKRLDGLKANTIHEKQQYLMAPLVLLHKTPDDKLMPVAIQLKQTPAEDNPIFLSTDSEYDWLTAKIFVRSADFNEHQVNAHLLRTHLLAEVFAVSLLCNVPRSHPLYKVLVPHTRDTLHINVLARDKLISKTGVFTKIAASGGEGLVTLMQKSLSSVTYSSLCLPDDIAERGLKNVPNFYYRDDGLKLWDIIHRFVQGLLGFYYENDDKVQEDSKLQKWIQDIFEHGFLSQEGTGIPQSFTTVEELVKFVTMVIFTCSAQHSAVNAGQYDYGGWMPNFPSSLQRAPPTKKGTTSEATMMDTLPDKGTTAHGMATLWLLSQQFYDFVGLGESLEDYQSDEIPCKLIKDFLRELGMLSENIKTRNESLEVPYTYMDPAMMENSVAI